MPEIHPQAIVEDGAKLHESVKVGAFSIVGPNVEIAEGTVVHNHVHLSGHTKVGKENQIFPFCSIGENPQDLTYKGEPTEVIIGDHNVFREYVSIHKGTMKDKQKTTVGSHCLLMAHVHLGHDVQMEDHCIVANSVNFAGHVNVGSRTIIGGGTNISQFITLGRSSSIGGASGVDRDIPHFCTGFGNRIKLKGINIVGLRRQGYEKQEITELVDFFRMMEASALSPKAFIDQDPNVKDYLENVLVNELISSITDSKIGIAPFI